MRRRPQRRGAVAVILVVLMVLLSLIVMTMVLGGGRDQDLTVRRLETVQAFYAAEAGINMAHREMMVGVDEDADGTVGTISTRSIGNATVSVTLTFSGGQATLVSVGRSGLARREIQSVIE